MDQTNKVMTPTEFVLWLNGATSMLEGPPSAEQWTKMQENLHPIIAKMMAEKLMGNAEEVTRNKAHAAELKAERERYDRDRQHLMDLINKQVSAKTSWDPYTNALRPNGIWHARDIVGAEAQGNAPFVTTGWATTVPPG